MTTFRFSRVAVLIVLITMVGAAQTPAPGSPAKNVPLKLQPQRQAGRPARSDVARNESRFAPDRILVRFRATATKASRQDLHTAAGTRHSRPVRIVSGLEIAQLRDGVRVADALRQYRGNPDVLYAEPDYRVYATAQPNDPFFPDLWGLNNTGQSGGTAGADIKAIQAWEITTGDPSVVVGIIDTGVDYTHSDLTANIWANPGDCNSNGVDDDGNGYVDDCHGIDTYSHDSDPMDENGHGTVVAGTIGATGNNANGVVGVNWTVKIAACRFIGPMGGYSSDAILCLEYFQALREAGVNIVATNNSWGGGGYSEALYDAIDAHRRAGILFIAAAGNDASDNDLSPWYPAGHDLPNIISVAATTRTDALAEWPQYLAGSSYGAHSVHLGAPGDEIVSTAPGGYAWASGTSLAAPFVTGVAALLKAQDSARDWRVIKNLILAGGDSVVSLAGKTITGKRLNALGAMTCGSSEITSRLRPLVALTSTAPGVPIKLEALHINCAVPAGEITVTVSPGGAAVTLKDDGIDPDQQAGDGVYSATWTASNPGEYGLQFPGGDSVSVRVLSPYKFATAPYAYRAIAGTSLNLDTDSYDEFRWIDAPFPVNFGGLPFTRLGVSSNGTISFTEAFHDWHYSMFPAASVTTLVAPAWTALWAYSGSQQNVFWDVVGSAPNRELVIEWRDVETWCYAPATATFQTVFFENGSDILFNYKDMVFGADAEGNDCTWRDNGADASSGVQVAPIVGTQYSYGEHLLPSETALRWSIGSPAPQLREIRPFSAAVGDGSFLLDAVGINLVPGSVVGWNGAARPTTFVDSSHLQAAISASDLSAAGDMQITVAAPGGATSAALPLKVYSSYPVPTITTPLSVSETHPGLAGLYLPIDGTNFVPKSKFRLNGVDHETDVLSPTLLYGFLSAADLEHAGTAQISVFSPAPGGGTSNSGTFTVKNPVPYISDVRPTFGRAGSSALQLAVWVTGLGDSVVRWNGTDRTTIVAFTDEINSKGYAYAQIPAGDLASPGSASITVYNKAPGGGTSNTLTFDVVPLPANDEAAGAIAISVLPFDDAREIRGATANPSDPHPSCAAYANTAWYRYDAQYDATVSFNTTGGLNGHTISVWTGAPGAMTQVACEGFPMLGVQVSTTAGTSYWVLVSSPEEAYFNGAFSLHADATAPAPEITEVTPRATGGGSQSTLHVTGSGYVARSKLLWDGGEVATNVLSATEISGVVPAAWLTLGDHMVNVSTNLPGGGLSHNVSVTVTGYALTASASSATVRAGQAATFSLTVTPDPGGFDKEVRLACVNPPAGISCSFSTTAGTPGTNPMTSTLTITTSATVASSRPAGGPSLAWIAMPFIAGIALVGRRRARRVLLRGAVVASLTVLISCGGGASTHVDPPPQQTSYTVNVTGTSGTLTQSTSLTVIVQH